MKNFILKVGFLLLATISISAQADNFFVVTVRAYHWDRGDVKARPASKRVCTPTMCTWTNATPGLNENNPGLGYEHTVGNSVYGAGFYKNSIFKMTTYLSYTWTPLHLGGFSAGPIASLVTGYPIAPVALMAGAEVRYDVGKFGANLILVPTATVNGVKATGFAGLQFRFKM